MYNVSKLFRIILFLTFLAIKVSAQELNFKKLTIMELGKTYIPDTSKVKLFQSKFNTGGSTSVRNVDEKNLEWKEKGYYQRNRDLGQVFMADHDIWLDALVLRTGPSDKAILMNTPGATIFIQFFEVHGEPRINDNGTPPGTSSKHGFTSNHRADDFIEGVRYLFNNDIYLGVFPEIPASFVNGKPVEGDSGRLLYLKFKPEKPVFFKKGKRYGFIVGLKSEGKDVGFTLANANAASINAEPSIVDSYVPLKGAWAIRREGNGKVPPSFYPAVKAPEIKSVNKMLQKESLFLPGNKRFFLAPTSDGYPDVDTYRSLEFYMEEANF